MAIARGTVLDCLELCEARRLAVEQKDAAIKQLNQAKDDLSRYRRKLDDYKRGVGFSLPPEPECSLLEEPKKVRRPHIHIKDLLVPLVLFVLAVCVLSVILELFNVNGFWNNTISIVVPLIFLIKYYRLLRYDDGVVLYRDYTTAVKEVHEKNALAKRQYELDVAQWNTDCDASKTAEIHQCESQITELENTINSLNLNMPSFDENIKAREDAILSEAVIPCRYWAKSKEIKKLLSSGRVESLYEAVVAVSK